MTAGFAAFWDDARRRVDARLAAVLAEERDPALRAALGPALDGGKRCLLYTSPSPRD